MRLWSLGSTPSSAAAQLSDASDVHVAACHSACRAALTFSIEYETFGSKKTPMSAQNSSRSAFTDVLPLNDVRITSPSLPLRILVEHRVDSRCNPIPGTSATVWFGEDVCGGLDFEKYSLKNRPYLGPTSMDNELSMIMSNLALVKPGSMVFDPFVGTGSILFSATVFGGVCTGTDIDVRVLRGKGSVSSSMTIPETFRKFNLPPPELVRSDNSLHKRHFRDHLYSPEHGGGMYSAIVTDPPYGIRAGARRSGSSRQNVSPVDESRRSDHIAMTQTYQVSDVMADLVQVAARNLVKGGRLVYLIPTAADFDEGNDLPTHPCLRLKYVCFQGLQIELGRRMVVMEKTCEFDPQKEEEYYRGIWPRGAESATKVSNMREKLIERNARRKREEREREIKEGKVLSKRERKKRRKIEAEAEGAGVGGVVGVVGVGGVGGVGGGVKEGGSATTSEDVGSKKKEVKR